MKYAGTYVYTIDLQPDNATVPANGTFQMNLYNVWSTATNERLNKTMMVQNTTGIARNASYFKDAICTAFNAMMPGVAVAMPNARSITFIIPQHDEIPFMGLAIPTNDGFYTHGVANTLLAPLAVQLRDSAAAYEEQINDLEAQIAAMEALSGGGELPTGSTNVVIEQASDPMAKLMAFAAGFGFHAAMSERDGSRVVELSQATRQRQTPRITYVEPEATPSFWTDDMDMEDNRVT